MKILKSGITKARNSAQLKLMASLTLLAKMWLLFLANTVFPALLDAMPTKYYSLYTEEDKSKIKIFCSTSVNRKYKQQLQSRNTALGDALITGGKNVSYDVFEIVPVAFMPDDVQIVTPYERLLLSGFHKGDSNNIWEISDGGLTLTVGTNVEYAAFVNDGHWTCGNGKDMRFVPGDVVTDSSGKIKEFHYNKNAKTGMMLKQKFVKGKHYWESGIRIMEKILPGVIEAKMQEWLDSYFGGD